MRHDIFHMNAITVYDCMQRGTCGRRVLIVVDMQHDFIDGVLANSNAEAIITNVNAKIAEYRARGDIVLFTFDTHFAATYARTEEGKKLPLHCEFGTPGWEIHKDIDYRPDEDPVVFKPSFGFNDWHTKFGTYDVESIELCGVCTAICVLANAIMLKTIFSSIPISVDASCCACVSEAANNAGLLAMQTSQIDILNF